MIQKIKTLLTFTFFYIFCCNSIFSQKYDSIQKSKRLKIINSVTYAGSGTSLIFLNEVWYDQFEKSNFHFFNDLKEWRYMDKVGHVCTAYQMNLNSYAIFSKFQENQNKVLLKSSLYSFGYLAGMEMLDGFSKEWGFSWYDIISNGIGTGLFAFQQKKWGKNRFDIKFSSHLTPYANCRPNVLGSSKLERIFKDYNGQTYWLTVDLSKFIKKDITAIKWLNLALGYSVDGLTGAYENPYPSQYGHDCNEYQRKSKFLLSFDINLRNINTKNKILKSILSPFSVIKIPFPTLQIMKNETKYYWLYF
ncbi:MAG: DUF2279 domain-containing protein [Crocinitomicaceae bacterium]|nr:DUF2279 domain-containing protein [Crocinitomicaceae bacterium]